MSAVILVVDDDLIVRETVTRILEDNGYRVLPAENGAQALEIFRAKQPDLVLTDIIMPEKEGIETIRLLRQQAPDLPILAISGSGLKDYLNFAMQLGATAALSKPFGADQLLATVADLVEGSPQPTR